MHSLRSLFLFLMLGLVGLSFLACGGRESDDRQALATQRAEAFASDFAAFRFEQAAQSMAPGADVFLKLYASNLTQADIDALHALEEAPSVAETTIEALADTAAVAACHLRQVYVCDTIGQRGRVMARAVMRLEMRWDAEAHDWRVRRASLPRSER